MPVAGNHGGDVVVVFVAADPLNADCASWPICQSCVPPLFIWMGEGLCGSRAVGAQRVTATSFRLPVGWYGACTRKAGAPTSMLACTDRQYNGAPAAVDGCQRDVDLSSLGFRLSHLSPRLVSRASSGARYPSPRPTTNDARWVVAQSTNDPLIERAADRSTSKRSKEVDCEFFFSVVSLRPYHHPRPHFVWLTRPSYLLSMQNLPQLLCWGIIPYITRRQCSQRRQQKKHWCLAKPKCK